LTSGHLAPQPHPYLDPALTFLPLPVFPNQVYISEANSISGSGVDGLSNVMVSAIWTIDMILRTAWLGCSGIAFHMSGTSPYSMFSIKNKQVNIFPQWYGGKG